jgi:hypothetical protein
MGVRVPTSLPVAATSVRWDMALAIIRKFAPAFDQVIMLSDPHFPKKISEEGTGWERMDRGLIGGTMGVVELDINLFHELRDSICIQRAPLSRTEAADAFGRRQEKPDNRSGEFQQSSGGG